MQASKLKAAEINVFTTTNSLTVIRHNLCLIHSTTERTYV